MKKLGTLLLLVLSAIPAPTFAAETDWGYWVDHDKKKCTRFAEGPAGIKTAQQLAASMVINGNVVLPADMIAPRFIGVFLQLPAPINGNFFAYSIDEPSCKTALKFWSEIEKAIKEKVMKDRPKNLEEYQNRYGLDGMKQTK